MVLTYPSCRLGQFHSIPHFPRTLSLARSSPTQGHTGMSLWTTSCYQGTSQQSRWLGFVRRDRHVTTTAVRGRRWKEKNDMNTYHTVQLSDISYTKGIFKIEGNVNYNSQTNTLFQLFAQVFFRVTKTIMPILGSLAMIACFRSRSGM